MKAWALHHEVCVAGYFDSVRSEYGRSILTTIFLWRYKIRAVNTSSYFPKEAE
jgi:hypothetical protein